MSSLFSRVDEIDVQVDKLHRLIEGGSRIDPELAAGLGCSEDLTGVQRKIDRAAAAVEALDQHLSDLRKSA